MTENSFFGPQADSNDLRRLVVEFLSAIEF